MAYAQPDIEPQHFDFGVFSDGDKSCRVFWTNNRDEAEGRFISEMRFAKAISLIRYGLNGGGLIRKWSR